MERRFGFLDAPSGRITLLLAFNFAGFGCALPYLSRWLEATHGLSGLQIAAIVSSAQLLRVVVGPLLAAWADAQADRRTPLILLSALSTIAFAVLFVSQGFPALLAAGFLAQTATQAVGPLVERMLMRESLLKRGLPYGLARGIGSAAFILGAVGGGLLIERYGVTAAALWIVSSLGAGAVLAATGLKPDPVVGGAVRWTSRLREGAVLLRTPAFIVPIAAASLIQASHAFYYAFSAIAWSRQGLPDGVIGLLWGAAVVFEIILLLSLPRGEMRLSPESMILLGGVAAIVRWTAFAFVPPEALLWPLQALHALSFAATHVGAVRLVQKHAPEAVAGIAQTLYAGLGSGTLAGLATLLSGALFDRYGAPGYAAMAVLAGCGAVAVFVDRRRKQAT